MTTDPSRPPFLPATLTRLRQHSALGVGVVAQFLQYGSGLILLPLIVTRMSAAEVGIWYIFITLQGLAALADFGFQPTFARAFASAYAGAAQIMRSGHAATAGAPNLSLVKDLVRLCRRFYAGLSIAVIVVLLLIGVFYLPTLIRGEGGSIEHVQSAWAVLSAGTALTIYFAWNTGFLLGAGRVSSAYWAQIASRVGFVVIGGLALLGGWGLLGLAVGNLVAVLAARLILQWRMAPLLREVQGVHAVLAPKAEALFSALWPNAARMGLVALGAFLITRLNVLVASSFFSLETAASYAITLQLLIAVNSVAQLPISVALPQMVRLRVQQQKKTLRSMWMARQASLLILFVIGVICVAFLAQPILELVGSNVALLPIPLVLLMGLVLLLEANHASCALVITTDNNVPFVGSALFSGGAVAVLSVGAAGAGSGIGGLILAQGLVQLAYNNWKWPVALWRELNR